LFDYLAALESVSVRHYGLFYDYGWCIDFHTLEHAITDRTRAVVLVNPTIRPATSSAAANSVGSEHFANATISPSFPTKCSGDYPDRPGAGQHSQPPRYCRFSLNGLSKLVGLPR